MKGTSLMLPSTIAARSIELAESKIGCAYVWGAAGPDTFDCSGLVDWAYRGAGYTWTHGRLDSAHQIRVGTPVAERDLIPGDLVRPFVGHIQLYAGGGQVIEATGGPSTLPVRRHALYGFLDATRLVPAQDAPVAAHPTAPRPSAILRRGSRGAAVRSLQALLRRAYPLYAGRLAVDGIFGPATEAAVREFQRRSGLVADGIVGPRTRAALGL